MAVTRAQSLLTMDWALAAHALDPRLHRQDPLPPMMLVMARKFVNCPDFDQYLVSATNGMFGKVVHLPSFWQVNGQCGMSPRLVDLGLRFSALRASSADVERAFSTLSMVYGTRRNRLGSAQAFKLASSYRSLRETPTDIEMEE